MILVLFCLQAETLSILQNKKYSIIFKAPNSKTTERICKIPLTRAHRDMIPEPSPANAKTDIPWSNSIILHIPNYAPFSPVVQQRQGCLIGVSIQQSSSHQKLIAYLNKSLHLVATIQSLCLHMGVAAATWSKLLHEAGQLTSALTLHSTWTF